MNIEQDFVLTNSWQGGTREAAIAAAQPAPVVAAPAPVVTCSHRCRSSLLPLRSSSPLRLR